MKISVFVNGCMGDRRCQDRQRFVEWRFPCPEDDVVTCKMNATLFPFWVAAKQGVCSKKVSQGEMKMRTEKIRKQ